MRIPAGDTYEEHYCPECGMPWSAPFASMACQCNAEPEEDDSDDAMRWTPEFATWASDCYDGRMDTITGNTRDRTVGQILNWAEAQGWKSEVVTEDERSTILGITDDQGKGVSITVGWTD